MASGSGGIGYLLKDRVFDSAQFVDAVRRVAAGGTAMDPEVIARFLARNTGDGSLATLSPREREVLALMAEGRSNAAIAQRMVITERAVAKHTASIILKLDLQPSDDDNRRVLAVLACLGGSQLPARLLFGVLWHLCWPIHGPAPLGLGGRRMPFHRPLRQLGVVVFVVPVPPVVRGRLGIALRASPPMFPGGRARTCPGSSRCSPAPRRRGC